jgi:branched-chain amino acid aminotransferase group I
MRAYSGHIFRLGQHLDRLFRSARVVGIDLDSIGYSMEEVLYATLEANGLTDARLRLTASGGEGDASPDLAGSKCPTVLVVAGGYIAPLAQEGLRAAVSSIRRNSSSPLSHVKSLNYLDNLLARREAKVGGVDEAILLNEEGFVAEGSSSNLFLLSEGDLITPDENSGILPGITRQVIMGLASDVGLNVRESKVTLEELFRADEAFLTNSVVEIVPLIQVDGRTIGSGIAGETTQTLMRSYTQTVQNEIRGYRLS